MSDRNDSEQSNQIAWERWRPMREVKTWQALSLSLNIDPEDDALDPLLAERLEFRRRRDRLLPALSDQELFSPVIPSMSDPLQRPVVLAEFAAWCITTHPPFGPVPAALFEIGYPLAIERQDRARKGEGRYTLEEAAEHLTGAGESYKAMLASLKEAAGKGRDTKGSLAMHEPGRKARNVYGPGDGRVSRVREFYEEVYWDDLNHWLEENESRIKFRFPNPAPTLDETRGAAVGISDPTRRLAALRALGGQAKWVRGNWKITGINDLTKQEKAAGRARCAEKTIRADLKEAAEAEKREGTALPTTGWTPR